MNQLIPVITEIVVLFAVFFFASLATWGARHRLRAEEDRPANLAACIRHLVARLARPLIVLLASDIVLVAIDHWPAASAWVGTHDHHVVAWFSFWIVMLVIALVEGIALQAFRLYGRMFPVPQLLRDILRGVLILVALFAILERQLHIDIRPLVASTALVTAVVGFALQGVLGNLLAGMSLHIVHSVVPTDWVAIGDVEGEVIETNWRETRLRTIAGHMIIVPNSAVASATLHNMVRPTPLRRHTVPVGASYSDAPAEVIQALLDSALAVPEVLRDPAPSAYLVQYADFGINYKLRFWTNKYFDRTAVEGDVMRMIWYQFKRRGIEIPFPMSDKLLNDFMEVVYAQRRKEPEEAEVKRTLADLQRSDFVSRLLVDEKGVPLLAENDLLDVARAARRVRFTRGETIFRQGDTGETCYVVAWGRVQGTVEYKDAGQGNSFDLKPGALFGEMSLITGLPRTATIVANEEVELLEISRETFTRLLSLGKDVPEVLARLVAERAALNAAAWEKLKAMGSTNLNETLKSENILKRFLRMLGRR